MSTTPAILMVVFNRPELTRQVFDAVRHSKPAKLYIAADGARKHVAEDALKCEKTRAIFAEIDWKCEVKTLFREENLGCGRAVSGAISWFFDHEEEGIILEDDCVPNPSFFSYCQTLLDFHRHHHQVMHIGGTNLQFGKKYGPASYYYSSIPHVWGWASWRRAWKNYDFNLSDLNFFLNNHQIEKYVGKGKIHDFWFDIFCKMNQKKIDTWDYQWQYAIWNNNGVAVIPQINLIKNIGFGVDATHTTEAHPYADMETFEMSEIIHPQTISINKDADKAFFSFNQ
ncbi:MAG: nucleotide-diphospho-sugar transferase [Bacteroidetes bacterium]|nr:nucleotide-diphospho-sugar transferase [Bacteroidota bacterium]